MPGGEEGEGGVIAGHRGLLSLAGGCGRFGGGRFSEGAGLARMVLSRLRAYALRLGSVWGEAGFQIVDPGGEEGVKEGGGLAGGEGGVIAGHWGLLSLVGVFVVPLIYLYRLRLHKVSVR